MLILERASAGAAWSLLSLSPQTFHSTQELLDRMQKHVAGDGCVHGLCVDFENTRVHLRWERELWIVASLAAAYNNSLTAQQLQYEADLYGRMYAPGEERAASDEAAAAGPDSARVRQDTLFTVVASKKRNKKSTGKGREPAAPGALAPQNPVTTCSVTCRSRQQEVDWDEELLGDRFIYDPAYEQNENIVPWNVRDPEERWGWYM
jgi:hypothetical protein